MSSVVGEQIFEYHGESGADVLPQINVFKESLKASADQDDALSRASINAARGFEYFNGTIYSPPSSEYSLADKIEQRVESPQQRIQRLKTELADLASDLQHMNTEVCSLAVCSG